MIESGATFFLGNDPELQCYWENAILQYEKNNQTDISIFPNPTKGMISIKAEGIVNVAVLDIKGRKIYSGKENKIDLSSQTKGIYIVKVTTNKGVSVEKIVLK